MNVSLTVARPVVASALESTEPTTLIGKDCWAAMGAHASSENRQALSRGDGRRDIIGDWGGATERSGLSGLVGGGPLLVVKREVELVRHANRKFERFQCGRCELFVSHARDGCWHYHPDKPIGTPANGDGDSRVAARLSFAQVHHGRRPPDFADVHVANVLVPPKKGGRFFRKRGYCQFSHSV